METTSEAAAFGVLPRELPAWLQDRMTRVRRLEATCGPVLKASGRKAVWEQLSMDGVAKLEGGAAIRAVVLGPDPVTSEGVAIVFIEGGVADRIVVRGDSIQGVHFEDAAYAALDEYQKHLPKVGAEKAEGKQDARPSEVLATAAASPAITGSGVPLPELGDSPVDARIRAAISAGVVLHAVDVLEIRAALASCDELHQKATRLSRLGADPMRKGNAFPMGVGFTRMTKRASQRIDASVRRAGEASELFRRAEGFRRYAEGLLAGRNTIEEKKRMSAAIVELQNRVVGELLQWTKGRTILKLAVTRVNLDRAGYPISFSIPEAANVAGDRVDVVRAFFRGNKQAFRALVDQLRVSVTAAGVGTT